MLLAGPTGVTRYDLSKLWTVKEMAKGVCVPKEAVKGHSPSTKAPRRIRLFQATMEHPAFEQKEKEQPSKARNSGCCEAQ